MPGASPSSRLDLFTTKLTTHPRALPPHPMRILAREILSRFELISCRGGGDLSRFHTDFGVRFLLATWATDTGGRRHLRAETPPSGKNLMTDHGSHMIQNGRRPSCLEHGAFKALACFSSSFFLVTCNMAAHNGDRTES